MTEVLSEGARRLLAQTVQAELAAFLAVHAEATHDGEGRRRLARNGYLPERDQIFCV